MRDTTYLIIVGLTVVGGCSSPPRYEPPAAPQSTFVDRVVLDATFDQVWTALIDYAGGSFFSIDSFEKESGLMTLSCGGDESHNMDCGHIEWSALGAAHTLNGPFTREIKKEASTDLNGRMNIVVRSLNSRNTTLSIGSRYTYTISYPQFNATHSLSFDGEQSATEPVGRMTVTCRSTGAAEMQVISGVQSRL